MLQGHRYWLRTLCSVINSTLDVYPKGFYFSKYPRKSAVFPIVRMVSAEFFLLRHVSPRLLGVAWLIRSKVSISLWLIPLHRRPPQGSPHLGLCSRVLQEKKPWPDSSPSCGRPSSAAAVVSPAFYCSTTMMKESKSRDVGLSKRISCGTLSKRIFLQAGDSFFFFFKDESPIPMLPHLFKNFWPSHTASGVQVLWPGIEPICIKVLCAGSTEPS